MCVSLPPTFSLAKGEAKADTCPGVLAQRSATRSRTGSSVLSFFELLPPSSLAASSLCSFPRGRRIKP